MIRPIESVLYDLEHDLVGLFRSYRLDPVRFCEDILRVEPLEWQCEFMRAVAASRAGSLDKRRFAIRSGTGVGKTGGTSMLILWHLAAFPDSKIPCTAPTAPQLEAVLWPEIKKWIDKIPDVFRPWFPYEWRGRAVRFGNNEALARTSREERPEAFQGFHADNAMLVADEASGVPQEVYLAGQGVMSSKGAITILIGNPTRASGYFYDAFNSDEHLYWTKRVGCQDSKLVTNEYIEEMRRKHGENSYEYKVRILGEFHLEDTGIIVPRPWVEDAIERDVGCDTDYVVWGVDVSNGKDKTALAKRRGNQLLEPIEAWGGLESIESAELVADKFFNAAIRPDEICVESTGMGTPFAQRLRQLLGVHGKVVTLVNVHLRPKGVNDKERYASERVRLWGKARDWFGSMNVTIPKGCETFIRQISSVEWERNENTGRWQILSKVVDGASPDSADAFILTFGTRSGDRRGFSDVSGNKSLDSYSEGSASYIENNGVYYL